MVRVQIDPWVNEKIIAFVENIEPSPRRIDRRAELWYEMDTMDNVVQRNDFCADLTALFRVRYGVHLCRRIDGAKWAEPLDIR